MVSCSKWLESKSKTSFHNQRAQSANHERSFTAWTNNNFYRTSYNDMTVKVRYNSDHTALPRFFYTESPDLFVNEFRCC